MNSEPSIWKSHLSDCAIFYETIQGRECEITLESRPPYCDRGNFIAKLFPEGELALSIDGADLWPRYYFDYDRAKLEVEAWLKKREQWIADANAAPNKDDAPLLAMSLFAWLGEDELGSGEIGLKAASCPAGIIPMAATKRAKMENSFIELQLALQQDTYGKRIALVRFAAVEIIKNAGGNYDFGDSDFERAGDAG